MKALPVLVLLLAGSAAFLGPALCQPSLPEAAPGTLVRWPGEELKSCQSGESRWAPLGGACWYPIDLLAPPGELRLTRVRGGNAENAVVRVSDYPYEVQYITLQDESKVDLSARDLERVRREQEKVGRLWSLDTPGAFRLPLVPPLEPLPEGGRFGARRFFNGQPRSPHTGRDFSAPKGASIFAAAAGRVVLLQDLFFSGLSVFIDHGDGLITMYFHLSETILEEGDQVGRGEVIGKVGQSGRATGPHLHFGVRWRGARVDPLSLMAGQKGVTTLR